MMQERLATLLAPEFTIERELGGGGMSLVFLARDTRLGRRVVIKVVQPELAATMSGGRFEREIQVAASLQQANIVPLLTAGEAEEIRYYTMPFVEGESLRARLARGPLSEAETISVLRDVARALVYAHERGVVHRDIKPDNVLLSGESAVVTDFGIAKAITAASTMAITMASDGPSPLTQMGTVIGTPAYMAPEQAMGDPAVDHRADLYAFGCMAFELLTGASPFHGRSTHQMVRAHLSEPPPTLASQRYGIDPGLEALITACLAKGPAQRPASAREVLRQLDAIGSGAARAERRPTTGVTAGGTSAVTTPMAPPAIGASPSRRWRRTRQVGIATGILLILALAVVLVLRQFGVGPAASLLAAGRIAGDSRILVTRFATTASDTSLSTVLAQAMRTALGQSEAIRLVSSSEVAAGLARMTLPPTTPLTEATAQQLAIREGIPLLVTGQVASLGTGFVVSVNLVRADSGTVLTSVQRGADGPGTLLEAIDAIARKLRSRIGESLQSVARAPRLMEATTPSLDALREYTRGVEIGDLRGDFLSALPYLEQAVGIDSTFASAWRKLAVYRLNLGDRTSAIFAATAAAYRHREHSVGLERALIEALYLQLTNTRAALALYDRTPQLERNNYAEELLARGRYAEAESILTTAIAAQRRSGQSSIQEYANLISALVSQRKFDQARATTAEMDRIFPGAWFTEEARRLVGWMSGGIDSLPRLSSEAIGSDDLPERAAGLEMASALALARGQIRRAGPMMATTLTFVDSADAGIDGPLTRIGHILSTAQLLRLPDAGVRELEAMQRTLTTSDEEPALDRYDLAFAIAFARLGAIAPSAAALERFERGTTGAERLIEWAQWQSARGELALARGDATGALAAFRLTVDSDSGSLARDGALELDDGFARAFEAAGQRDSAVARLERMVRPLDPYGAKALGAIWPSALRRLAMLHEALGRPAEARRRYEELLRLWRDADPELQPQVAAIRARLAALPAR